jgi:hypothetical protein
MTPEQVMSRCYEHGQPDYVLAADTIKALLAQRDAGFEAAIDRMGWPEIHAFQRELKRGQDYREDAGGFMMRAIRRLFGLPSPYSEVVTYQEAARAMVEKATSYSVSRHDDKPSADRAGTQTSQPDTGGSV